MSSDRELQAKTGYLPGAARDATPGLSEFAVHNGQGAGDAIVRLYRDGQTAAVRSFSIKKGEKFTAGGLAPGRYAMRYRYRGSEDTYEADRTFVLSQKPDATGASYSTVIVTLFPVSDGNLQTKRVSSDSF